MAQRVNEKGHMIIPRMIAIIVWCAGCEINHGVLCVRAFVSVCVCRCARERVRVCVRVRALCMYTCKCRVICSVAIYMSRVVCVRVCERKRLHARERAGARVNARELAHTHARNWARECDCVRTGAWASEAGLWTCVGCEGFWIAPAGKASTGSWQSKE